MKRTNNKKDNNKIDVLQRVGDLLARGNLARKIGWQYEGDRKIYEALGYPKDSELDFTYYYNKYERQDIATAVIDRPVEATWDGEVIITEEGEQPADSKLFEEWAELEETFKIKSRLVKLDKLTSIGQFGLLMFGFDDVKDPKDFKRAATGTRKLLYLKQIPESAIEIDKWVVNASDKRYGLPLIYKIVIAGSGADQTKDLYVHHSRVIHTLHNNLTSEVYGRPRLKPIVNRLNDLEKLLGGDAEMFWRGARPGYHAAAQENYEMGSEEIEALEDELDKYEHDLRRFISAKGVDIKPLQQQVADPSNHIDVQLQAISAQTGIPKRILVGSERGELSSTQDKDQWLTLIQARMNEYAEPMILRPFINKLMEFKILSKVDKYVVIWEDIFAPSEKQKVEVGEIRAKALKVYADSPYAANVLPPVLAYKYLFGLNEDQAKEIEEMASLAATEEDRLLAEEARLQREEEQD